jgi:hypothetical protein
MQGPVIPASRGRPAQGIQTVRQRGAGYRGEPAVTDRELLRQVIVDRHVGAVVVAHHASRVATFNSTLGKDRGRAGDEAAHAAAGDLLVDRVRTVVRVHLQGRGAEMVHRVGAPLVGVGEPGAQAVDLRAPAREGQVAEHVVKGPVLQHHDHNVVDLRQAGRTRWVAPGISHRSPPSMDGTDLENQ